MLASWGPSFMCAPADGCLAFASRAEARSRSAKRRTRSSGDPAQLLRGVCSEAAKLAVEDRRDAAGNELEYADADADRRRRS